MSIKIQNSKQIKNERNWKVSQPCYSVQPVSLVPGCTGGRAVAHAEVCIRMMMMKLMIMMMM